MDAIRTEGLVRAFGEVRAIRGLDLTVPEGSFFGFLGPNGAGKTTTIRVLATVIRPDSGTAIVAGHDILKEPLEVRRRIGLMVENPGFYPDMSVIGNLLHHATFYDVEDPEGRASQLLREVRLHHVADRSADGLSFGMRKRLALAQALMTSPDVLLLDEPTTGLDPEGIAHARELLKRAHASGCTIFMSTHILSEVDALCDRVAIVRQGKVITQGSPEGIKDLLRDGAGRFIEFHVTGAGAQVMEGIAALGSVTRTPWGFALHGFERGADHIAARVNDMLVEAGLEVSGIIHREMSLEDAYLEVVERKRRQASREKGKPGRRP
ncbi:MAG: ABC transporter ATP-binding protein [Thermoplasmata archaeon]|nr:ABC transporter ATP-binding protein [Thermoplasmata archaeon]